MSPTTPATTDQCKSALRALFSTFSTGDKGEPAEIIATYLIACSGYPLRAIEQAVIRFIRGEVDAHDGRFVPTSAELSREISRCFTSMLPPPAPRAVWLPSPQRQEPTEASKVNVRARLEQLKQQIAERQMKEAT